MFKEGIKQPIRPFYSLFEGKHPGGEIVRQGGLEWGYKGKLWNK